MAAVDRLPAEVIAVEPGITERVAVWAASLRYEDIPEPVLVRISGSNWGGSMLKAAFLGRGMHLEYKHPKYRGPIVTSAIVDIRLKAA